MIVSCTNNTTLRVIDIVDGTIVDGPGLRTSIYFAGCAHFCPGCHNPQSWPFDAGQDMTIDELVKHVEDNEMNVTLSGGDPLYQMPKMLELCQRLKVLGMNIWLYTGFIYEQVCTDSKLAPILDCIDVLVDGPFIEAQRDIGLRFRGSPNQRLIDIPATKATGTIALWTDN